MTYREGAYNEWISINDKIPEGNKPFLATDNKGYIRIGYVNWITRHTDEPGLYLPAKYGEGMRIHYWMPIPDLPKKKRTGGKNANWKR